MVHHLSSGIDSLSLGTDLENSNCDLKRDEMPDSASKSDSWTITVKKSAQIGEPPSSNHQKKCGSPTSARLAQIGVLYNPNRTQYIKKKAQIKKKIDQLNYSARFTFVNMEIKLHSEGSIMTTNNNFIAAVKLEHPERLDDCSDFGQAREVLIEQLRITRIYRDGLREHRDDLRVKLIPAIESAIEKSAFCEKHANNYIQLVKIMSMLENSDRKSYRNLCWEIGTNKIVSDELKTFCRELFQLEETVMKRKKWFTSFGIQEEDKKMNLNDELEKMLKQTFDFFQNTIKEGAPDYLQKFVYTTCEKRLMLISIEDIKLFKDIATFLNETLFQKPLKDLITRWNDLVNDIKIDRTREVVRLTKSIFFYLCKSLEEVIIEISNKTGIEIKKLLTSDNNGWYPLRTIKWKIDQPLNRCLEYEYYFLFKLIKHFDITHRNIGPFNYNVALLNRSKSSTFRHIVENAKKIIPFTSQSNNHLGVPDETFIWYCMLDDVLSNVLPFSATKHGGELDQFGHILQNYTKLIREAGHDQLETVRVISHSLGRFIVQAIQLLKQDHNWAVDRRVLHGQLDVIGRVGFETSNYFRDLIDVFSDYWRCRNEIIALLPAKIDLPEMKLMCEKLLEIILIALSTKVGAGEMVHFCRAFNDYIIDLGEVQFDWFVKNEITENECLNTSILQMIENKWSDTDNASYRVVKLDDFVKTLAQPPKHYTIDVINTLLSNILTQLGKSEWSSNNVISAKDRIVTSSSLISAVRSTLIYLADQPDYVSFDRFYEERVRPFVSVVENSTSCNGFSTRINLIKESFWYIRKQNEMSIDHALELFGNLNENFDGDLLRKAYNLYCEHFDKTLEGSIGKDHAERVEFVAKQVKKSVKQIHFKLWNSQFKQHTLPTILAKVSALWTVQVSKDVSSTVGYFKPHCIQVLCVLRMLSADTVEEGVGKHFAQVSTGQGKSLVLALTAAILALTGHSVDIVCYNKYLVARDYLEFLKFFEVLKIDEKINYNTFQTMANKMITLEAKGKRVNLRELVENQVLNKEQPSLTFADEDREKSILLIDEVDVFFTEEFYGAGYFPCIHPIIPGLDLVQEYIWKIVNESSYIDDCKKNILASDKFNNLKEYLSLKSETSYELLLEGDDGYVRTSFTNEKLFDDHLQIMIDCAWKIKNNYFAESFTSKFKISERETICFKDKTGEFSNASYGYYNIFSYFKLKKTDFVTKIGNEENYGYFLITCGAISYALLPLKYPLILGVTGTLTDLNIHEKDAIENLYEIKQLSFMPSFFGCSNLRFDEEEDFHWFSFKEEWMSKIFQHTYTETAKNRAVIIFFETDKKLEEFHTEYSSKFDRINILTVNTKDTERDQFINEAGVAKTVTLATRRMGRGVDFKSSVVVEKNGGVHVIQTFFSTDVKEEIQIKGRTARKDNKGSYELIVCGFGRFASLPEMDDIIFSYQILDEDRKMKSLKTNVKLAANIKKAKKDHELTMEYLKSFCEKK